MASVEWACNGLPPPRTHPSGEQARFMTFVGSVLGRTVPEKQADDASILTGSCQ